VTWRSIKVCIDSNSNPKGDGGREGGFTNLRLVDARGAVAAANNDSIIFNRLRNESLFAAATAPLASTSLRFVKPPSLPPSRALTCPSHHDRGQQRSNAVVDGSCAARKGEAACTGLHFPGAA
jgi:hypothetical protein